MEHILTVAKSAMSILKPMIEQVTGEEISEQEMAKITMILTVAGMAGVKIGTELAKLSTERAAKRLPVQKKQKKVAAKSQKALK